MLVSIKKGEPFEFRRGFLSTLIFYYMTNNLFIYDSQNKKIFFNFGGLETNTHNQLIDVSLDCNLSHIENDLVKDFYKDHLVNYDKTTLNYVNAFLKLLDKEFNTNFLESFESINIDQSCFIAVLNPQTFNILNDSQMAKLTDFLNHLENLAGLEFELEFNELDREKLQLFFDQDNFYLDENIKNELLFSNLENLKNVNDFQDFLQELKENFDSEITYHETALEYLRDNDPSLKESLKIAHDIGYSLKNLNSEVLASLLCQENFNLSLNDYEDELKIIFDLINKQ